MPIETEELLSVAQGEFKIKRLPVRPLELLRGWDAADEYVLDYLAETIQPPSDARILIVNDTFGALAVALNAFRPCALSDSYLSHQATQLNLVENGLPPDCVRLMNSLETIDAGFDVILIKVPKTLALLEDELIRLHPLLTPSTQVIVAGMIKHLPSSIWKLLERLVGETTTSLARKKARLIFALPDARLMAPSSPYPVHYRLEGSDYLITNHANVFSRDSLDIGTRFFLQHIPVKPGKADIVDLGCGNGLLGLKAAEQNPDACIYFVDESFMAVASAKENFYRAFGLGRDVDFCVGDGLTDFKSDSVDLVLCNPPFHQHNTVGNQIAVGMFKQAHKALRPGGELRVIGNRHLEYHTHLNRIFGAHSIIASNSKFIIFRAIKGLA